MLLSLLHVSALHRCHHQSDLSVDNVAPSKWSDSLKVDANSQTLADALKFQLKHKNFCSTNINYCVLTEILTL